MEAVGQVGKSPSHLSDLNERLARYLTNIRDLEKENARLEEQRARLEHPMSPAELRIRDQQVQDEKRAAELERNLAANRTPAAQAELLRLKAEGRDLDSKIEELRRVRDLATQQRRRLEEGGQQSNEIAALEREVLALEAQELEARRGGLRLLAEERAKWEQGFQQKRQAVIQEYEREREQRREAIRAIEEDLFRSRTNKDVREEEQRSLELKARREEEEIRDLRAEIEGIERNIAKLTGEIEKKDERNRKRVLDKKGEIDGVEKEIDGLSYANISFRNEINAYELQLDPVSRVKRTKVHPISEPPKETPSEVPREPLRLVALLDKVEKKRGSVVPGEVRIVSSTLDTKGDVTVELQNETARHLSIGDCKFEENSGSGGPGIFSIPSDSTIPPKQSLLILIPGHQFPSTVGGIIHFLSNENIISSSSIVGA